MNRHQLIANIRSKRSFLCVGLDTDPLKLPKHLQGEDDAVFRFNCAIVDATAPFCVAYKPNLAFYEAAGPAGVEVYERTVAYIKSHYPDQFVIADAKRGDIGNTSSLYARAMFEGEHTADALTVAPYMGKDSVTPFLQYEDKWVVLLALTSNPGSHDFQMLEDAKGKCLFEHVLETSQQWGAGADRMMYVVGATQGKLFERVRKVAPDHFLLVPGVGAQGGSLDDVCHYGLNADCGLLVNSSRGIIFADSSEHFAEVAAEKAQELQQAMSRWV